MIVYRNNLIDEAYCKLFISCSSSGSTDEKLHFMKEQTSTLTSTLTSTASTLTSVASTLTSVASTLTSVASTPNSFLELHSRNHDRLKRHGIHIECINGNIEVVKRMIELGVDINVTNRGKLVPLSYASYYGHTEIVKLLLEADANPNLTDANGGTPLCHALECEHIDIVKLLLKAGTDPNTVRKDGMTPLSIAIRNGSTESVTLLLNAGAIDNYATIKYIIHNYVYNQLCNLDNQHEQHEIESEIVADNIVVYRYPLYKRVCSNGEVYIITMKLPVDAMCNFGYYNSENNADPIQKLFNVGYRASAMYVESIHNANGDAVNSVHNSAFKGATYTVGQMVYPDRYELCPYKVYASGIHFYMRRELAECN